MLGLCQLPEKEQAIEFKVTLKLRSGNLYLISFNTVLKGYVGIGVLSSLKADANLKVSLKISSRLCDLWHVPFSTPEH